MRDLQQEPSTFLRRAFRAVAITALVLTIPAAWPQGKKKDDQANTRSVQGVVTSPEDALVAGAVVQLKNTKTLQIRSFVTQEDGHYYFHGLNTDLDYEIKAEYQGASSPTRTLSSFDSRKDAVLNLKLKKKGE